MTRRCTADAREALDRAGLSRRRFMHGTGAMVVAFASGGLGQAARVLAQGINGRTSPQLDSWIAIGGAKKLFVGLF